jgi:cytochrome P450
MTDACPITGDRNVIEFDHHASTFGYRWHEIIGELHATGCPLGWSPAYGGFWAIYGYKALYDAVQDPALFSSAHSAASPKGVPPFLYADPLNPIDVDGPPVQELRRILMPWLAPGAVKTREPRIRAIVTELIDEFIEYGECDLMPSLLQALPAYNTLELLGWEIGSWRDWVRWLHSMIRDRVENPDRSMDSVAQIHSRITKEIEKRRTNPSEDIFMALLKGEISGEPMTEAGVRGAANLLLLGGMNTTASFTGNVLIEIDRRPNLREQLLADRSLIRSGTEEFLRHEAPALGLYRTVTRDVEFHGQPMKAGDRVVLLFPAGNLDRNEFQDTEAIDLGRTGIRHMAFGLGVHRCVGSHLGRLMFQVMLEEIFSRMPDFRISGEVIRFRDCGETWGMDSLPISFTPGRRSTGSAA